MRVGIDIGGTFTDLVAIAADGTVSTHKTASTPGDYSVGIATGMAALLAGAGAAVVDVLHATTVGSNTILENKIARTALLTTRGFRDVLEIRDLRMPRLYDINWTKPEPLVPRDLRLELTERVRADGSVAIPLDPNSLAAAIKVLVAERVESVAICLLHSYANPAHEAAVERVLHEMLPHLAVTASHKLLPELGEYPRTSTTVVNAAIRPVVRDYLGAVQRRLAAIGVAAPLRLMQSNGGLASAETASMFPARIVESGPAAGVVGAAVLAARLGEARVITFDMGGTTAKAGLVENGQVARAEAMEVGGGVMAGARLLVGGGYMLKLPSIDLAEVGAGGGSLCRLDPGGAPKVGPQSAGADPGPACYGRGGEEPTITDCNLVLGILDPAGLVGGRLALDVDAATRAIERRLARPMGVSVQEAAFGMLRIAASTMMQAIRAVSVERGHDVRACAMMAFGGNGPMFAAAIARELGIARVIVPPMPGVFSAFGLLLADTEHHLSRSIRMRSDTGSVEALQAVLGALLSEGQQLLAADGFPSARRETRVTLMARYVGQSSEIAVPQLAGDARSMLAALPATFGAEHLRSYGFRAPEGEPIEITSLGVIARGVPEQPRLPTRIAPVPTSVPASRRAWFERHGWLDVPVLDRAGLSEAPQAGPLIVQEYDATCLVPPGCDASIDGFGNIRLTIGADADG